MALTPKDIARLAQLARLELDPGQHARMLAQLNGFFAITQAMQSVDTRGVEPLAQPMAAVQDLSLRLREDVVSEPDRREAYQSNAPAVEDGLFLVPRVIE